MSRKPSLSFVVRVTLPSMLLTLLSCAHDAPKVTDAEHGLATFDCLAWEPRPDVENCHNEWVLAQQLAAEKFAADKAAAEKAAADRAAAEKADADRAAAAAAAATAAAAAAKPEAEPVRVYVGADAYFDFNRANLTDNDTRDLDTVAGRMQKDKDLSVHIVGYADQLGAEEYNMFLSQRRADAVRAYLIERGLSPDALSVEARGETDPIVSCEDRRGTTLIDCLQPNRRVEIEFSALEPVGR
jgi:outer membrane protein OmpA-like peptidoglycan-associated protein